MANRPRRPRARAAPGVPASTDLPRLAPLALAALLLAAPGHAATWRVTPSAGLTETYSDNVSLQSDANATGAFVTEARAGVALAATGRRLKLAASAEGDQFLVSRSGLPNISNRQLQYRADANVGVIDELLFVDASASSRPQSISAFGPQLNSNAYATDNRTQVRTWRLSPYLRHRFGGQAELSARYTRDEVDSGTRSLFGNSSGRSVNLDLASGRDWRTLGWGLHYLRQDLDNQLAGTSSSQTASADLSWRLMRTLSLTASGGYDKYDYQALGGRTAGRNWSTGFVWTPSSRTRLQASVGRAFFGNTASLAALHRSRHTIWSLNYSDLITTTRAQFLLPATIDTAAMLDRLYAPTIPDPLAREQAVAAYLAATGLPPSLAESINYFSNRFMRQKQLQAAVTFKGARSDLMLSAFDTARTALSAPQSDSPLLAGGIGTLNDDTRQHGLAAMFNYRLSARTIASASANDTHTRSQTTGYADHNRMVRVGLTRQFSQKLRGMVDVRSVRGGLGAGSGRTYRENAVSATLSMQL